MIEEKKQLRVAVVGVPISIVKTKQPLEERFARGATNEDRALIGRTLRNHYLTRRGLLVFRDFGELLPRKLEGTITSKKLDALGRRFRNLVSEHDLVLITSPLHTAGYVLHFAPGRVVRMDHHSDDYEPFKGKRDAVSTADYLHAVIASGLKVPSDVLWFNPDARRVGILKGPQLRSLINDAQMVTDLLSEVHKHTESAPEGKLILDIDRDALRPHYNLSTIWGKGSAGIAHLREIFSHGPHVVGDFEHHSGRETPKEKESNERYLEVLTKLAVEGRAAKLGIRK